MRTLVIPPFVKPVGNVWTLAGDGWTTPYVVKSGRLAWDESFLLCTRAIESRIGLVIDVGAFIGDSAAWFSSRWDLLTFEPQRDAYTCLAHNLPRGQHLPFPAGNGEVVDLSFGEGGNMGARCVMPNGGNSCRTIRIDDLHLSNVVFIKIDVEGWESKVIEGALETIQRWRPAVRVEFNKAGLDRYGWGYESISHFFKGWKSMEVFRNGNDHWDTLYLP